MTTQITQNIYSPLFASIAIATLLSLPTIAMLHKIKSKSVISPYAPTTHQLKSGTPNMGGIFVIATIIIAFLIFAGVSKHQLVITTIILLFALIGFLDDYVVPKIYTKRGLGWIQKLTLQILAVQPLWLIDLSLIQIISSQFFILFYANAINFTDGLDGLAASILILSTFAFIAIGTNGHTIHQVLAFVIIGALIPFLYYNSPPASIFMGDVGSLPLGAAYGILFSFTDWQNSSWPWIVSIIFIIELVLVPIQIIVVKTLKRRLFPATPIHHAFEIKGWPESKIVWTFILTQGVLTIIAIAIGTS